LPNSQSIYKPFFLYPQSIKHSRSIIKNDKPSQICIMKIMRESAGGIMGSPKCVVSKHKQAEAKATSSGYPKNSTDDTAADMYGYGDALPDAKYGYDDAIPDSAIEVDDVMKCKYGYGVVTPDYSPGPGRRPRSSSPRGTVTRRSSMKGSISSAGTFRRRASIGQTGGGGEFEVVLPGHSQPVRRRRSITFNEGVMVCEVLPTKSLTDRPESLWLQDEEFDTIKQQISSVIQDKIRYDETHDDSDSCLGSFDDEDDCCTRGLERMLQPKRTKVKKFQALDTVMNEQYLQRQDGEFDDESLAIMYRHATRRSQREAEERASKDAEEIEAYLSATRRMCRRLSM
jgi:hypothetical protein